MTTRRDKNVKGASVISGHRMEPDLAQRLTAYAHEHFTVNGKADVAAAARYLLRSAFGKVGEHAFDMPGGLTELTRGLKLEPWLYEQIEVWQANAPMPMSFVGVTRHMLRLALGFNAKVSLQREQRFVDIASARRGLMEEG